MADDSTFFIEEDSEEDEVTYLGEMEGNSILINVEDGDGWYQNRNADEDVLVVTMATTGKRKKDEDCLVIGASSPKRKRSRCRKLGNLDCTITSVSHDSSRDQDILYVSTDKKKKTKRAKRSSSSETSISTTPLTSTSPSTLTTSVAAPSTPSTSLTTPTTSSATATSSINPLTFATRSLSSLFPCTIPSSISSFFRLPKAPVRGKGKRKRHRGVFFSSQSFSTDTCTSPYPDSVGEVIKGHSVSPDDKEASDFINSSSATLASSTELPSWWISSNQSSSSQSPIKFSLIDLESESFESKVVSTPLSSSGLMVMLVQRIQSPILWRRYMAEVRLLLEERGEDFPLNEKLLYHCSCANKDVICIEGLDARLSRNGNFGRGIYFRLVFGV